MRWRIKWKKFVFVFFFLAPLVTGYSSSGCEFRLLEADIDHSRSLHFLLSWEEKKNIWLWNRDGSWGKSRISFLTWNPECPALLKEKPGFLFFALHEKQYFPPSPVVRSRRQGPQAGISQLSPLQLLTPLPWSPWITRPSFYHPTYLMPVEDEWLWLKQLNTGKTKVWWRVNLTALQNFLSLFPVSETKSGSLGHPSYLLEFF